MNIINEPIRVFMRILNADRTPATGIAGNITAEIYNPLLVLALTPGVVEIGATAVYYVDFTPDALGAWLVTLDCSSPPCYSFQVFDVDEDIIEALRGFTAQAY